MRGGGPGPGGAGPGLQPRRSGLLRVARRRGAGRPALADGLRLDQPRRIRGVRAADRLQEVLLSRPQVSLSQYVFVNVYIYIYIYIYNFFYSGATVLCSVGKLFLNVCLRLIILDEVFRVNLSVNNRIATCVHESLTSETIPRLSGAVKVQQETLTHEGNLAKIYLLSFTTTQDLTAKALKSSSGRIWLKISVPPTAFPFYEPLYKQAVSKRTNVKLNKNANTKYILKILFKKYQIFFLICVFSWCTLAVNATKRVRGLSLCATGGI